MSWQSYIDDTLVGSGVVSKAAIISSSDGAIWSSSPDFIETSEGPAIAALTKSPKDVVSKGILVAGVEYIGTRGDDTCIMGKKDATGIIAVKTKQYIIIAYHDETIQDGDCFKKVRSLGDQFRENGY